MISPNFVFKCSNFTIFGKKNKYKKQTCKELEILTQDISEYNISSIPNTNAFVTIFNMILGRFINIVRSNYGYIQIFICQESNSNIVVAQHGMSFDTLITLKHFINVPIKLGTMNLGAIGWGAKNKLVYNSKDYQDMLMTLGTVILAYKRTELHNRNNHSSEIN